MAALLSELPRDAKIGKSRLGCTSLGLLSSVEIRIWSTVSKEEIVVHSAVCWPREVIILPWCCLVLEEGLPPVAGEPYFQLHESAGESVDGVYQRYRGRAPVLKGLFIIMDDAARYNKQNVEQIKDPPFLIVIISNQYKSGIMNLVHTSTGLEATVIAPFANERHPRKPTFLMIGPDVL